MTPSIFHHCPPLLHCHLFIEQCCQPLVTGMYDDCRQLLHCHAFLPSPCISSAIISGASWLFHHFFVDACCKSTLQPLSCAAIIVIVFIAISSLTPSIFHHCPPLLHCPLFIEQCRQPSVTGMYCTIIVDSFFIAMHSCHRRASQVPSSLVQVGFFAISLLMCAVNLPCSHCHVLPSLPLSSLLSLH